MNIGFKQWINVNEAGGFMNSIGNFVKGMMDKKYTDKDFENAANNFAVFLKQKHGISWNNSDAMAKNYMIMIAHGIATDTLIPSKVWIDVASSLNKINKDKIAPIDLAIFYRQAHNLEPDKFPFPPGEDPKVIPDDLEASWNKRQKAEMHEKSSNKAFLTKEEWHKINPVYYNFISRSGFRLKSGVDQEALALLIGSLYFRKPAPWRSMLKRVYGIYRNTTGRPSSALDFIQHLTHHYDLGNNNDVEKEAEDIDSKLKPVPTPSPPPKPNPASLTPREKVIERFISHIPKYALDPTITDKKAKLTIDDWRRAPPNSPDWKKILLIVNKTWRGNQKSLQEFLDAL